MSSLASDGILGCVIVSSVSYELKQVLGHDLVRLSLTSNKHSNVKMGVVRAPLQHLRKYFLLKDTIIDFRERNSEWSSEKR